jgi:hypothetical protein
VLAGRGFIANIDVAIGHDENPLPKSLIEAGSQRATACKSCTAVILSRQERYAGSPAAPQFEKLSTERSGKAPRWKAGEGILQSVDPSSYCGKTQSLTLGPHGAAG